MAPGVQGAALAQVCTTAGVPFALARTISDRADDSAHVDFPAFVERIASRYAIRSIPTLMIFKNGNVEATKVGALSKSQLAAFIDSNL